MQPPTSDEAAAWEEARAYRDEHERLSTATEHLARAGAELTRAVGLVGDHASAVALSAAAEDLQLIQAQLAAAAEKALSLGRMAVRRAQHASMQRQANEAMSDPPEP
jgi:hypothetical protein